MIAPMHHSHTTIQMDGGSGLEARYFVTATDSWIALSGTAQSVDLTAWHDDGVIAALSLKERARVTGHLSVEQARTLRDSLTVALAEADAVLSPESETERARRLA